MLQRVIVVFDSGKLRGLDVKRLAPVGALGYGLQKLAVRVRWKPRKRRRLYTFLQVDERMVLGAVPHVQLGHEVGQPHASRVNAGSGRVDAREPIVGEVHVDHIRRLY